MTYDRFEDLPVWNAAQDLAARLYLLTDLPAFQSLSRNGGDLADQLRRAALSISNNIAKGFERGSTPDLLKFLYIARGSAGETRSMLHFALRLPIFSNLHSQISNLLPLAESCSRQIRAWADSLQNSTIAGQRHLNDDTRETANTQKRADAFIEKLKQLTPHLQTNPNSPANNPPFTPSS